MVIISKKILSLFIAAIMLFNLTAEIFANTRLVSRDQQAQINSALNDAYNNNSSNSAYNLDYYEKNYQNSLKELANVSDKYQEIANIINKAAQIEQTETSDLEILNNNFSKVEKDFEKYNKNLESYKNKINNLGGIEKIEQKYALYQNWLDLKPDMENLLLEQENIIKENKAKLNQKGLSKQEIIQTKQKIVAAKDQIAEYNKNYFAKEKDFESFIKDFDKLAQLEENLDNKAEQFEGLFALDDRITKYVKEAKEEILSLLPQKEGLTAESDWDKLFDAAQAELDKLTPALEAARKQFEKAEKAQNNAYQKYLEDKFENEFSPILIKYCQYVSKEADKYNKPAVNGKINGHNTPIEPGSVVVRSDGSFVADIKSNIIWEQQKKAYLACINPSWDEEKLKSWQATITMDELSDLKYGEYLLKYGFEEGKHLTSSEIKQMGQLLAKKNIGMAIVDPERSLDYFYTLLGDLNQSKKLIAYLKNDWNNKGYGFIQTNWEENAFGDLENNGTYTLTSSSDEGDLAKQTYIYKLTDFDNTRNILIQYFNELNILLIDIMNYLAQNPQTGAQNLDNYLNSIGVSLTEDFLNIDENLINKKLNEINRSLTKQEKESFVEKKIQKRPFDPLMFALGPSHLVDRNRTLARERRNALKGFDLDNSQAIKDILFFNTLLQTNYRIYKPNLNAWNDLAYSAYEQKAMKLLASMSFLGNTLNTKYEKEPQKYFEELEEDLHEYGKDFVLDIGLGLLLGGITVIANSVKTFVTTTAKTLVKNSIKVAFKSSFKQGVKALGKRTLTLAKMGAKKSIKSIRNVFNGNFKSFNANSLRNPASTTTRTNINNFRKIKFQGPIRKTNKTLGRELGAEHTLFNKTLRNIRAQYGIRPNAVRTSKIFNTDLSKQQYLKLTQDLNAYEKSKRIAEKEAKQAKRIAKAAAKNLSASSKKPYGPCFLQSKKELEVNLSNYKHYIYRTFTLNIKKELELIKYYINNASILERKVIPFINKVRSKSQSLWKKIRTIFNPPPEPEYSIALKNKKNLSKKPKTKWYMSKRSDLNAYIEDIQYHYKYKTLSREQLIEKIKQESQEGRVLYGIINPETDLLDKDLSTFANKLLTAIANNNQDAIWFFEHNILTPEDMIVFNKPMNILGAGKYNQFGMPLEKLLASISSHNIMVLKIDKKGKFFFSEVTGHNMKNLMTQMHNMNTGKVLAVFKRPADGRLVVITEASEKYPVCAIVEPDETKQLNTVISIYQRRGSCINSIVPKNPDGTHGHLPMDNVLFYNSASENLNKFFPLSKFVK